MTVVLALLALAAVAIAAKATLFSSQRVRRMRWRIMVRLRPGPGFATLAELTVRWSRLAALHHGRRARPSMRLHHRITVRTTAYAIRLGRAQYGRRVFARAEDQTLILSLPRSGKSGMLGDRVIDHPGAVLVTESRPDIYTATAGYRARLGPIEVFNPEHVSGIPSTFTWGMTIGCEDPAEAIRRATDLVGAVANVGEMAWWVEKSAAGTKIFLPGIHDTATLEDVSRLCGTLGDGGAEHARRVMPPELLARLPDWHALVVAGSRSPVVIRFRPSWRRIEARLGRAPKPLTGYGRPITVPPVPGLITGLASRRAAPAAAYGEEDHDESA